MNFSFSRVSGHRLFSFFLPVLLLLFAKIADNPEADYPHSTLLALNVTINSNAPVCSGSFLTMSAGYGGGTAPYTFLWNGPAGFSATQENVNRPNIVPAHAGIYGLTVTDFSGMTGTASLNVLVDLPATVNAGPDRYVCEGATATLNGSIGGSATSASWHAAVTGGSFSPNNASLQTVYTPPPGHEGLISFSLITNDPPGACNSQSDQVVINFYDTDGLICNDEVEIALGSDCSALVTPDDVLEGDIPEELYSVNIFTPTGQAIGNIVTSQYVNKTLRVKVTDQCNWNFCFVNAKIVDRIEPTLTCQDLTLNCAITSFSPEYLKNTLNIPGAYPTATDNCSAVTLGYTDVWTDVLCGGTINGIAGISAYIRRTWTATDASGNKKNCTQYIYFKRIQLSEVQFPVEVSVSCRNPVTTPAATGTPYVTQFGRRFNLNPNDVGYCELSVIYTDQIAPSCTGTYNIIRSWQIFDFCNPTTPLLPNPNPLIVRQIIQVRDFSGPTFQCPVDMTVSTALLSCCTNMGLPNVIVSDSCSKVQSVVANVYTIDPVTGDTTAQYTCPATLTNFPGNNLNISDTLATFKCTSPCLPVGKHRVVYTATDACGQIAYCAFNATVEDLIPPVVACDEITQVSLGIDGMSRVNATTFDDGSYDNCGKVYFKVRRQFQDSCQRYDRFHDQAKFCCEDVGDTVIVILRVYDVAVPLGEVTLDYEIKHSNECEVQVYVDDKLRPVCVPPPNVTVDCANFDPSLWAYGMASAADNCCLDTITKAVNYNQFDTLCNRGTILRTFRAFDCKGQSNTCTQQVVVNTQQRYFIKFPDDKMVTTCDGTGVFGKPEFFGEHCGLLATAFKDDTFTVVPDACYKIERHWTIINWCSYNPNLGCRYVPNPNPNAISNHANNLPGPIVSAPGTPSPWASTVVKVNPADVSATNYSQYWGEDVNCYTYTQIIKILDKQKPVIECPPSPKEICDLSDNHPELWNNKLVFDPMFKTNDLCEAPTDLCISATDACSGGYIGIRYLLFLDVDNNGSMETVINSVSAPPAGIVYYNNAGNANYLGGTPLEFDNRTVVPNAKRRFSIRTTTTGSTKMACVSWNTPASPNSYTAPELPYGKHKIKWIVQDGCGNEQVCEYGFEIKDCKAPTIYCRSGLTTNIMPTGMVPLFASFFIEGATDNCTPKNLLVFSIRKSGTGTGFPVDAQGNPIQMVSFDCTELGLQLVEIWVKDKAGNADFCRTYVLIQDNADVCGPKASIGGILKTEGGSGLEEANIQIKGKLTNSVVPITMLDMTDPQGKFMFSNAIPISTDYTLTPLRDDNPLNGVSTLDLTLISKHILGIQPLASPYKIIAADANNSKTVTTLDIVEIRKLILGITENYSNITSWRFVDKSFVFPNPNNPFQTNFPESKVVANVQQSKMDEDFVSIKVGDLNGTALANNLMASEDRSAGTLYFEVTDVLLKAGETTEVAFNAEEPAEGYQFTLLHPGLELEEILPGKSMSMENFGVFKDANALTTSYNSPVNGNFHLRFRAKKSGKLSQMLSLSGRITTAEAYRKSPGDEKLEVLEVALRFKDEQGALLSVAGLGFELYQNQPNPFANQTVIGFYLPGKEKMPSGETTKVTLSVYDESGKEVYREEGNFPVGYNHFTLEGGELQNIPDVSLLYYKVETDKVSETRKMIKTH